MNKIIRFGLIGILIGLIIYGGIYLYAKATPKLSINSANSFYLYDDSNELFSGNNDDWIGLNEISDHLINATLAIEDKNFYSHQGFDFLRILKALYVNIKSGKKLQGASTISQQYAKNLFLDFDKTWERKIEEAWLTIRLESHYDKEEILEGYLNTINYGGIFGIENASKYYFGKSAKDLNLAESSMLAGIPKSPNNYSPLVNEEKAKERQYIILSAMVKNDYINQADMNEAYEEDLIYIGKNEKSKSSTLMYYQDAVMNELKSIKSIPNSFLKTGGLKIYTNLNMETQMNMEENMNKYLDENNAIQMAGIMIEPNSGKVLALTGGRDYSKSQFNRAINAKRQVGSTMKPFLYYAALENGFTPSTTFTSSKTTFAFSENKTYSPQNFGDTYPDKPISMAAALAYSDNIYAVKTHLFLGEETLVNTAKRVGIDTDLKPLPSLALGSQELSLMEMIKAYATLANEGYKITPHLINKVEDINGNILYEFKETKENVLNKSIVYVLNEMLSNCYSSNFIDYTYPTCINIAAKVSQKYAVKTGSTDTDNLVFGYNKDILMGIWTGYDDNKLTNTTDGNNIKNVWIDTVEQYLKNKETSWYNMPNNVVGSLVNPVSGELIGSNDTKKAMLYYIKGTEPSISNQELDNLIPTIKEE
ncbi:MAG: PBP1A family penicillin-binding protein [Firmicutes bacterium]|nr:PBP1A family penicillin-binding protein [Bacillota bacterium]